MRRKPFLISFWAFSIKRTCYKFWKETTQFSACINCICCSFHNFLRSFSAVRLSILLKADLSDELLFYSPWLTSLFLYCLKLRSYASSWLIKHVNRFMTLSKHNLTNQFWCGVKQLFCVFLLWIMHDLFCRTLLNDFAVLHHRDFVSDGWNNR